MSGEYPSFLEMTEPEAEGMEPKLRLGRPSMARRIMLEKRCGCAAFKPHA